MRDDDEEDERPRKKPAPPKDAITNSVALSVTGLSVEQMMESARFEAARLFGVPANRIKVHINSFTIASRDPFPTDLSTYAAVDMLSANAACFLVPDENMPAHDRMS